ncbi:hypothetical protein [Azospirillum canadense]|uniref:hypothetical protein n=1 Tax=Azospirillum canadense TaxID=403962 RepID=UPI002227CD8E|nr:hypothetical protein [Azospirillum canadense]MCW2242290.1 hypothetical protein [Azospirillum canadense]
MERFIECERPSAIASTGHLIEHKRTECEHDGVTRRSQSEQNLVMIASACT